MDQWEDYKLGDAVKGWNGRKGLTMPFIDFCCDNYPGSIVCDYRRRTSKFNDVKVLTDIVERRAKLYHAKHEGCYSLPKPKEIVVHLRLGDTLSLGARTSMYVKPVSSYDALVGKNLTVVTNVNRTRQEDGSKHKRYVAQSNEYLRTFARHVSRGGSILQYRTCLPDEDFVYMSHANTFVKGGGGFSHLIYEVNGERTRRG